MIIKTENFWSEKRDGLILTTSSGFLDRNKHLVKKNGFAHQVAERFPLYENMPIQEVFGYAIAKYGVVNQGYYEYGLITPSNYPSFNLGLFQTKYKDTTVPHLIQKSANMLIQWCKNHPTEFVHVNLPGTTTITHHDIYDAIRSLPNTVTFWTLEPWWERSHYDFRLPYDKKHIDAILSITGGEDPDNFFNQAAVKIEKL